MAFIGLRVPAATARLFGEIDVPGDKEDSASLHVTIIYLGEDVDISALTEAIQATYAVTSKTKPFTVRTSRVFSFPENPDYKSGHPVISYVESDDLHALRDNLVAGLDGAGIEFNKKYPSYRPHVTVAYSPEAVEEFRIPTIEWGAHEIVMWGGDEGDRKLTVTFPLALSPSNVTAMARRVASRFTSLAGAPRHARPNVY